jgi:glycosyltransferase involved in cell wall biosynthesis
MLLLLFLVLPFSLLPKTSLDLTLMGIVDPYDGLGKNTITLAEELSKELNLTLLATNRVDDFKLSSVCKSLLKKDKNKEAAVLLFTGVLSYKSKNYVESLPPSRIKIAYSMFESTRIPASWVKLLNTLFDAVCVPDIFLVDVYKNSGVQIPLFVIPCPIDFKPFLHHTCTPKKKTDPFIFGSVARLLPYKNQLLLIEAFAQEFAGDSQVKLVLHCKNGDLDYSATVKKALGQKGYENVSLLHKPLSEEKYIHLMSSFDCYVLVSQGEGYSITPREALCLGIPSLISCNTTHISLCKTGYFYPVESSLLERPKHFTAMFGAGDYGYQFNSTIQDLRKALRDIYQNYGYWKKKALEGKNYCDYDIASIKQQFITLVKPRKVVLGSVNSIDGTTIHTNSQSLYKKYLQLL